MKDSAFDTIPVFNEAVAVILGRLYSQHPVPVRTHPILLADGEIPYDWDLTMTDRQQVFEATLAWLAAEDFIREGRGATNDGFTGDLTLTFKGLTAVNGVPSMLAQGEALQTFGESLREAVKKQAAEELAALGSKLLKAAGSWVFAKTALLP